jgi:hypothetical protein
MVLPVLPATTISGALCPCVVVPEKETAIMAITTIIAVLKKNLM